MSEKKKLLDNSTLLNSCVVANNRMNRGRGCLGSNSYERDLSFNPLDFLRKKLVNNKFVSWLDICCGEGRALVETATNFADLERAENTSFDLRITGVDLAGMFCHFPSEISNLTLLEISIEEYEPEQKFDLITCVHGLHYIGDKLSVIQRATQFLKKDGIFLANLDLKNLKLLEAQNADKIFTEFFSAKEFIFDKRKQLLSLKGAKIFDSPFTYQGADDKAGPNYTGQPAVDSYYELLG